MYDSSGESGDKIQNTFGYNDPNKASNLKHKQCNIDGFVLKRNIVYLTSEFKLIPKQSKGCKKNIIQFDYPPVLSNFKLFKYF